MKTQKCETCGRDEAEYDIHFDGDNGTCILCVAYQRQTELQEQIDKFAPGKTLKKICQYFGGHNLTEDDSENYFDVNYMECTFTVMRTEYDGEVFNTVEDYCEVWPRCQDGIEPVMSRGVKL